MAKTTKWVPVYVRLPEELEARVREAAGLRGHMSTVIRRALVAHLTREGNSEEYISVGKMGRQDQERVRRYIDLLRIADPDIRELADLQIQRLARLNARLK